MGSAGESEVAALYYNCKSAIPLWTALEEMGHHQPKTPAVTDNSTAAGLINKTMTPKRAKAYDQRFNWLKCREAQKMFHLIWKSGKLNRADFHTKKHPIHVYQGKRGDYVAAPAAWVTVSDLQGCAWLYLRDNQRDQVTDTYLMKVHTKESSMVQY